jgi:hypothetical protein
MESSLAQVILHVLDGPLARQFSSLNNRPILLLYV